MEKKSSLSQDADKAYQAVKSSNVFGILSIVAGAISLFTGGMAGIIGVILAIIGLVKKEKKSLCIIGLVLSTITSIVAISFFLSLL